MRYYHLLGLSRDCTEAEVRTAYRRLARRFHPDSGAGDVARFREIQEAYDTLSDPQKRRAYDSAHRFPVSWSGGFQEPLPAWPTRPAASPLPGMPPEILLTEEEAMRGGEAVREIARDRACDRCRGAGKDFFGHCPECGGQGSRRCYERVRFRIPKGAESGELVTGRRGGGEAVEARIRVASRGTGPGREPR